MSLHTYVLAHPKPSGIFFQYGTAGFRTKGHILDSVMFRMGLLAVLRSRSQQGRSIGVMVTASHNPEEDNGVKLIDPDGEMLAPQWEQYATQLANCDDQDLAKVLEEISQKEALDSSPSIRGHVITGRDTRSSSPSLIKAVLDGVAALGAQVIDMGIVSTPQVHFAVRKKNRNLPATENDYFETLATAFKKALVGASDKSERTIIDGSNGVGASKAKILANHLGSLHQLEVRNESGTLNFRVGADFVKTSQAAPDGVNLEEDREKKFASLDGDADRLIYFYLDSQGTFHMLDGDKIATLYGTYIREELSKLKLEKEGINLEMGVVQTAYANGASTKFLQDRMKVKVACVPTGVKYLHHKAAEFDVGVYFEANGHGTVTFREETWTKLAELKQKWDSESVSKEKKEALDRVLNLPDLINQAIGDALSDLLFVEVILRHKNWTLADWDGLYKELPNRLRAQKVADRSRFKTTDAERRLVEPVGLQQEIDTIVTKYNQGRSFVRPSGTEDIVRIYAEAATKEEADQLAEEVSHLVAKS